MIFARVRTAAGITEDRIYAKMSALGHDLFANKETMIDVLRLEVSGKTYTERKESLRACAVCFQYHDNGEADILLSMGERAMIENWFSMNARRYGLTEEFAINGVI